MNDEIIESPFETFENKIPELAKNRYRVLAFIIDFIVFWLIGMILGVFFGELSENGTGYSLNGLPALVLMLIGVFLWPISEGLFGQTLGKRFLDIKVVTNDYKSISMGKAFIRFFLGFIDYIFAMGLIIAIIDKNNQRIGDMAAKTVVIKHKYKKEEIEV